MVSRAVFATSCSGTEKNMFPHGTTSGHGRETLFAMMMGTQPRALGHGFHDTSTIRVLHGAQPNLHRQKKRAHHFGLVTLKVLSLYVESPVMPKIFPYHCSHSLANHIHVN